MTKQTRHKFSTKFKAKVALEAANEQMTLSELAKKFEVNPVVISRWKAEFLSISLPLSMTSLNQKMNLRRLIWRNYMTGLVSLNLEMNNQVLT